MHAFIKQVRTIPIGPFGLFLLYEFFSTQGTYQIKVVSNR